MGRPENPLTGPPHRQELARRLREMRAAAEVTYDEMAATAGSASAATYKRAASGAVVPRWTRVVGFCLAILSTAQAVPLLNAAELRELWVKARMEQRGTLHLKKPRPEYIADMADLSHALYALYEYAGAPTLREVQGSGGESVHLPLSTLARIVGRETLPADKQQLLAFVRGCRVEPGEQRNKWVKAWTKVTMARMAVDDDLTSFAESMIKTIKADPATAMALTRALASSM